MKDQSSSEVAGVENRCIGDAAKSAEGCMNVDDALEYADDFGDEFDGVPLRMLADEVRRLREVEQRFRKPLETPTAADGSGAEPVKARIDVDPSVVLEAWPPEQLRAEVRRLRDDNEQLLSRGDSLNVEVRRLREELRRLCETIKMQGERIDQLRRERDLFRTASEAAEQRIVELREQNLRVLKSEREALDKLARVEALPSELRELADGCAVLQGAAAYQLAAHMIENALHLPSQPEREPKLPFNGY